MHEPKAKSDSSALSRPRQREDIPHPRPLLHCPRALIKPRNAHTTGI